MNAHETFYLAQRAHNLLQPLIAEAAEQGIKVTLNVTLNLGEPFGSPVNIHVWEVTKLGDLDTIGYQPFLRGETLKEYEEQLDGLVEHVRDALVVRADLRTLVNA